MSITLFFSISDKNLELFVLSVICENQFNAAWLHSLIRKECQESTHAHSGLHGSFNYPKVKIINEYHIYCPESFIVNQGEILSV